MENRTTNIEHANENKLHGNLTLGELVMSVLAFSAPLVTMAGTITVVLGWTGNQVPTIYIICIIMLLLFSVGFVRMGSAMKRPGGFYAFVTDGLGKPFGLASAFLSTMGYAFIGLFTAPFFGTWCYNAMASAGGPDIPWWIYSLLFVMLSTFFAYRKIDLSAKVLFWVMILETIIIVIFDVASFINGAGTVGATNSLIAMPEFAGGFFGVCLLMQVGNFLGFESTVIYREEVVNPDVTIPRATYIAVLGIGAFYCIGAIAYIYAFGPDSIIAEAAADPAGLFLVGLDAMVGKIVVDVCTVLTLFSTFACELSIQNVATRYLFSLGTDGVLPKALGKVHKKHTSPYVAALCVGGFWVVMVIIFAIIGGDPNYLYPVFSGSGSFCVILVMLLVALAVLVYLTKNKNTVRGGNAWNVLIAPILGLISIALVVFFAVTNYDALVGSTGLVPTLFFILVFVVGAAGVVLGLYLRKNKPEVYKKIGRQEDL